MQRRAWSPALRAFALLFASNPLFAGGQGAGDRSFTADFPVDKAELSSTGRNAYFVLEPGYQLILQDGRERIVVTVQDETKVIAGVETRVVEERETLDGKLTEVSRNYLVINKRTNDVFYFGEEVDIYRGDKIAAHDGSWQAGVKGAKFGLLMPGRAVAKAKYYHEHAPGVAMDRFEIVGTSETVKTPAGEFKGCLKFEETSPLEPGSVVHKYYAPGVGLVQSESLKLVSYGKGMVPK